MGLEFPESNNFINTAIIFLNFIRSIRKMLKILFLQNIAKHFGCTNSHWNSFIIVVATIPKEFITILN